MRILRVVGDRSGELVVGGEGRFRRTHAAGPRNGAFGVLGCCKSRPIIYVLKSCYVYLSVQSCGLLASGWPGTAVARKPYPGEDGGAP